MKILKVQIVLNDAADHICIFTDLPCPFSKSGDPSQQPLSLDFRATYDTGIKYVRDVFNIEPEIINSRLPKEKFSKELINFGRKVVTGEIKI